MKLKHLSAFSMLLVLGMLISSCAVNHKVEKQLLGTWKPVTVENISPPAAPVPETQTIKVDTSTDPEVRKEADVTLPATRDSKAQQMDRLLASEMRSPFMLAIENNQRLAEKYFPGKTIKGTWKLKKKGKRIAFKELQTDRKINIDIESLTDSTLVISEKLPPGDLRIKYAKQK
jgi:hypothetical protein